jgi:hypothetical protein
VTEAELRAEHRRLARARGVDPLPARELQRWVRVLARWPETQQRVWPGYMAGLTYREIAEELGGTYTYVNRHVTAGRRRFVEVLGEGPPRVGLRRPRGGALGGYQVNGGGRPPARRGAPTTREGRVRVHVLHRALEDSGETLTDVCFRLDMTERSMKRGERRPATSRLRRAIGLSPWIDKRGGRYWSHTVTADFAADFLRALYVLPRDYGL